MQAQFYRAFPVEFVSINDTSIHIMGLQYEINLYHLQQQTYLEKLEETERKSRPEGELPQETDTKQCSLFHRTAV